MNLNIYHLNRHLSQKGVAWAMAILEKRFFKGFFRLLFWLAILGVAAFLGHHLREEIPWFEAWLQGQGFWAPLIFVLSFCLLPALAFSTDVMCFLAGALFGFWSGLLYAFIGMLLSASLMFFLSRRLLHRPMQRILARYPRFRAIEQALSGRNLKVLLLLRAAPIPFAALNYLMGVSKLSFKTYFFTVFGTSLTVIAGVYFGYTAKHLSKLGGGVESLTPLHLVFLFIGLLLTVLALMTVARVAQRELKQFQLD